MPLESLEQGVPWDWESFGDYLGKLDGKLAVNAGFMVGHSAVRRVVMGDRAVGEEATPEELEAMKQLLARSIEEGGMGFSTTISPTHNDGEGQPVPSRHASRDELVELARVCRDYEGTTVEFLPGVGPHSDEGRELMIDVSLAAKRPVNWNVMAPSSDNREMVAQQLKTTTLARERGAEIIALTVPQPMTVRINLYAGFVFDALADWNTFFELSIEERMEKLRDPEYRTWLDDRAHSPESGVMAGLARWEMMTVDQGGRAREREVPRPHRRRDREGRGQGALRHVLRHRTGGRVEDIVSCRPTAATTMRAGCTAARPGRTTAR